jgi:hypothetical protein
MGGWLCEGLPEPFGLAATRDYNITVLSQETLLNPPNYTN